MVAAALTATVALAYAARMAMPAVAGAEPQVALTAALTPEHLGAGTTIHFSFTIEFAPGEEALPLQEIDLLYPENLGIATSGLGLSTCNVVLLEADGPPGCPANSVMGYGTALVEVPFGPEILHEMTRTTTFMAPLREGHLGLLFYVEGESPVYATLVFPGNVLPAAAPYGGDLNTDLPLVGSLPEGPDAALVTLTTTFGPSRVTYFEYRKGARIPYHPRGVKLPRVCPRGGFAFGAKFAFYNGDDASAETKVPCPPRPRAKRHAHARGGRVDR